MVIQFILSLFVFIMFYMIYVFYYKEILGYFNIPYGESHHANTKVYTIYMVCDILISAIIFEIICNISSFILYSFMYIMFYVIYILYYKEILGYFNIQYGESHHANTKAYTIYMVCVMIFFIILYNIEYFI